MAFDTGVLTFDASGTGDVDEFLYTDPLVTDATLPQTGNVVRRWNWEDADTPSTDIGPTSGAGGSPDGYLYNETSDTGTGFDDEYYLEYDTTIDASDVDIEVRFKTNQRGNDNDVECVVETNENAAGWVERGSTFGGSGDPDKVATGGTQIWTQRSVDLTGLISHASTRIRIKLTLPSAGTTWHNDYGIDDVQIIGVDQFEREQEGFRFKDDVGGETDTTWLAAQDADISRSKLTNTRLRVLADFTGDAPNEGATLQERVVGDPDSEWRDV